MLFQRFVREYVVPLLLKQGLFGLGAVFHFARGMFLLRVLRTLLVSAHT